MRRTEIAGESGMRKAAGSARRQRTPLEKWLGLATAILSLITAGLGLSPPR